MIKKSDIQDVYPLSPMQQSILFACVANESTQVYFDQNTFTVEGELDPDLFARSFDLLVEKYDALRIVFTYKKVAVPRQIVLKKRQGSVSFEDISDLAVDDALRRIDEFKLEDRARGFSLGSDMLMRITVFKIPGQQYKIVWSSHHIIMDGWCLSILFNDLIVYYRQLRAGRGVNVTPATPYSKYIQWLQRQDQTSALNFWTSYLQGYRQLTSLPRLSSTGKQKDGSGDEYYFELGETIASQLRELARSLGVTVNVLAEAAWSLQLQRYNNCDDVVFGVVVSGRPAEIPNVEHMVGLFINTVPVRMRLADRHVSFAELAESMQRDAALAKSNEFVSLADIQAASSCEGDLLDHIMVFENYPVQQEVKNLATDETLGFRLTDVDFYEEALYDFNIILAPDGAMPIKFLYNADVYSHKEIVAAANRFQYMIRQLAADPQIAVERVEWLPEEERRELMTWCLGEKIDDIPAATLDGLVLDQWRRHPHRTAIIGVADHEIHLTYDEWVRRASALTATLSSGGVTRGRIVALAMADPLHVAVGILGTLMSGAAYLPIDPDSPTQRFEEISADTGFQWLVVENGQTDFAVDESVETVWLAQLEHSPECVGEPAAHYEDDPAYIIYTSGSTGKPKGVAVPHRGIVNSLVARSREYRFASQHKTINLFSYTFDGFLAVFFTPTIANVPVVSLSRPLARDIATLATFIPRYQITHFIAIPPLYKVMLEFLAPRDLMSLEMLTLAGDKLDRELIELSQLLGPHIEIVNEYGVTEASVMSTVYHNQQSDPRVKIGRPTANAAVFVMDNESRPQPVGVVGEIFLGGMGLALGYLNKPELTAEKFKNVQLPGRGDELRLYRSGDLGRWLPDGNLEILGRNDRQVKIRGFRIETGEIESSLGAHPLVSRAIVTAISTDKDKQLCAFVVSTTEDLLEKVDLAAFLSESLPDYMIPALFVQIESVPLTANGKVDVNALKDLIGEASRGSAEFIPPQTGSQKQMAAIWQELLGAGSVGLADDFFRLGGHSLKATMLAARMYKEFGVRVPLEQIFRHSSLEAMSRLVEGTAGGQKHGILKSEKRAYYPLSSAQRRLFFLNRFENSGVTYNMTSVFRGTVDRPKLEEAVVRLIQRHEPLRTSLGLVDERPVQYVHEHVDLDVETLDGTLPFERLVKDFVRPFDLARAPLLRVGIADVPGGESLIFFDMHHIIADGSSVGLLLNDFAQLYNNKELSPLDIQYKDFAVWQTGLAADGALHDMERYWLEVFSDAPAVPRLNLPLDYPRPKVQTFEGDTFEFVIDQELLRGLKKLERLYGTTLFMNVLAALNILLFRYSLQEDIIIGAGVAGRTHADLEPVIGMFVNMLAMRNSISPHMTFRDFLETVKNNSLNAFENQAVQFEDLVEQLDLERSASRNPLFDVAMVVQNFALDGGVLKRGGFTPQPTPMTTSKFDLTLYAMEADDRVELGFEYCTALFKKETVARLAKHLLAVVRRVAERPDRLLGRIDILDEEERVYVLEELNRTDTGFETEVTVLDLFTRQVSERPDQEALVGPCLWEGDELSWTYERLRREASRVSGYLLRNGVRPEEPVAVLMEPSLQRIAAVLGVLFAGGAFVPMPMTLPEARLRDMIRDAGIRVVISQTRALKQLNRLQWECPSFNRYLLLDSHDGLSEIEAQHNELMDQSLWHHVGETAEDDITGGGWMNSFTGAALSRQEMDEYGDNVLRKVEEIIDGFDRKIRVLEIGCASGITMFRVAPLVDLYVGTDLSKVIIEKNRARVAAEQIENIRLYTLAAHEVDRVDPVDPVDSVDASGFDLVIINSVIQCFHGHNYLKQVVRKAVDLVGEKGFIFVGDVMALERKTLLEADTLAFQEEHFGEGLQTKTDWSVELFVARAFWDDLTVDITGLSSCRCTKKIHTIENELTKYRYDALLTVDKTGQSPATTAKLNYQDDLRALADNDEALVSAGPRQLAYMIYTSGTTGKPRGVMLEHGGLLNLCRWHHEFYDIEPKDRATLYAGFGFDASVWELFPYLTAGAGLYIVPDEARLDMGKLAAFYRRHLITVSFLPTPIYQQFMDQDIPSLRVMLTGGDRLHVFKPQSYKLYNNYGPTEYTVVTTAGEITEAVDPLPIGKPIANTRVFILHPGTSLPQPLGVPGELCIAGPGIARGYLNHPLSNETSFVEIEVSGNKQTVRVYRSGDLARWLPDGTIEFLGRIDQQVKIRGYRIELADIEEHLLTFPGVREAAVVDRQEDGGGKILCGYVAGIDGVEEQTVKDYLLRRLPDYMVPAYIVNLDALPLTPNGKVDRRALPAPGIEPAEDIVAPDSDLEVLLAEIWSGVLGIPPHRIGVTDNFFQRGGDSIKTIQVSSRLQQHGYSLEVKDFFLNPTIRELATVVKRDQVVIDQGIVEGNVPLTPIQCWFFDTDIADRHHFNQAVMLELKRNFTKERIMEAFERLVSHHDVLRLVAEESDAGVAQRNRGLDDGLMVTLEEKDLRDADDLETAVQHAASDIQKSVDLAHGPLVKLGWFHIPNADLLLVVIHHLVVDGVSWRILLEDLATLLATGQIEENAAVLPAKTHSFQYWAQQLNEYSRSEPLLAELDYWRQQESNEIDALPMNRVVADEEKLVAHSRTAHLELNRQETGLLQNEAHRAFNTEINDILLAGLALALYRWGGLKKIALLLEGHGREAILQGVNINRTVGWFTSQFPVLLTAEGDGDPARLIKETKETLRRLPSRGVGYGILRYLSPSSLTGGMRFDIAPEIAFNYLGEMGAEDETGDGDVPFVTSRFGVGEFMSPRAPRRCPLDINGLVADGRLQMSISFLPTEWRDGQIETLCDLFKRSLLEIIDHCTAKEGSELTPADLTYSDLSFEELDALNDKLDFLDELE